LKATLSANSAYSILFAKTIHFKDEGCSSYNFKIRGELTLLIRVSQFPVYSKGFLELKDFVNQDEKLNIVI